MPIPYAEVAPRDTPDVRIDPSISDAIRSLVNMTESNPNRTVPATGTGAEEVMLDAEVDGERYLLVRMPRIGRGCFQLSPREHEIVRMVAKGHPNKVIADVLNISPWTVCTHLRRVFAKMGVGSRAAMVAKLSGIGSALSDARPPACGERQEFKARVREGLPASWQLEPR